MSRNRVRTLVAAAVLSTGLASVAGPPAARAADGCAPATAGGDWRQMGRDLGHSRHQPAEDRINRLQAPLLQPAWSFSVNEATDSLFNEITGYPIVADGCLFVGSNAGRDKPGWVFALNADGGNVVWKTQVSNGIYSTLAVEGGVVYAFVSRISSPYVAALDQRTGRLLWRTTVDTQEGSDAVSSPIVYDGMVWVGVSGTAAEGDESTRFDFRGSSVLLQAGAGCTNNDYFEPSRRVVLRTECFNQAAGARGGHVLAHTYSIPDEAWQQGNGAAGGAIWSSLSIDPASGFGFVGTGNPFNYEDEHPHTNAMLKIDVRRTVGGLPNPRLGKIAGSYKGNVEEYFPAISENASCDDEDPVGFFLAGFECGRLDLDFGASPNVFRDRSGKLLVGIGQKSGVYHAVDPAGTEMQAAWKQVMGAPSAVGGIVGTAAYDGTSLYVPHSIAGYLASLDRSQGTPRWVTPVADGVHWGNPVTSANGVIYTVDLKGFLDAYDAGTGAPLLHRPMELGANTGVAPTLSWGGVTVARHTVYASVGVGLTSAGAQFPAMPDGFVIAFKPARTL